MVLKVYNTATRKKEFFTPIEKGKVRMYVCGITPYDLSHVGHARSYVAFDVIRRVLEFMGFEVRYVQNFTDVDDKIIERAKEEGVNPLELSGRYIEEYFRDMDALGVKRADGYPRVSEKIPEIIDVIKGLIEKKVAYEVGGDVYLDVTKKEGYGKLSGQDIEELKAGARVKRDEKKKIALDFALWKKAKVDEISWQSPWGEGRPGWHIECSVMSMEALGATLDIHGGGQDLIFPHHENEIAQSESYTDKPFARYWLHNGLVTVEGQKMSKSLGNFITVKELLERYNPQTVRFFLLSAHYKKPLDFSERAVKDAEKGLMRIQNTLFNIKNALVHAGDGGQDMFREKIDRTSRGFVKALEDDFNVPKALAVLFDFIRQTNTYAQEAPLQKSLNDALETIRELAGVLGLKFEEEVPQLIRDLMDAIIKIRSDLRAKRDFAASDEIRKQLLKIGIILEDHKEGTVWRFIVPLEPQQ
jgi:cysteinyl-tRNA synthetase